jgi:hypothetical protein
MRPGLTRAVPVGLLGFLIGALVVLVLRWVQGLDPVWDAEIAVIVATFTSAGFFVWGLGAFDPRMSEHPHEPQSEYGLILAEDAHEDEAEEEEAEPVRLLGATIWQVSFWTIVVVVVLFGLATMPHGFTLQQSNDPEATFEQVGYYTMQLPFDGPEVEISQLTLFAGFIIFTLASLTMAGGAIALLMTFLSQNVAEARANPELPLGSEPPAEVERTPLSIALTVVKAAVIGVIVYALFYFALIGLVLPQPEWLRVGLSLVHAVLITWLVLYPVVLLRAISRGAGWLARVLRGLPAFLGNR